MSNSIPSHGISDCGKPINAFSQIRSDERASIVAEHLEETVSVDVAVVGDLKLI